MTTTIRATTTEAASATATNPEPLRAGRPVAAAAGAYLGELFAAHSRTVLGLCRLLLRDAVEAEDATQQVFLSAHRSILRGRLPRDEAAWLAAIARNECRARIRMRMREPLALPEIPDDLPDPLASAIRNADLDALWNALSELPRRQRRALLLREMGGLSYGELGAALGVTRPAVESLLFRARRHLRHAIRGANAALVPVALRDQLAQLIPGFGGGPAASAPVVAKIAAVTAVGLTAAGAVELPHSQVNVTRARDAVRVHRVRTAARGAAPEPSIAQAALITPKTSERRTAPERQDAEREQAERDQVGTEAEPSDEEQAPAPLQPEEAAPMTVLSEQETSSSDGRDSGESSSDGDRGASGSGGSSDG
jgi:RNA polymerase sigma factor (sigma-70 family)